MADPGEGPGGPGPPFIFRPNEVRQGSKKFFWRSSIARHLFFTGFTKNILTAVITRLESQSQSTHSNLLSKRFSSRSCLKFRRGNNARNGVYSFLTEVIAYAILVCLFFERRPPKKCAGLGTFDHFDKTNPITEKSIQLRSPDYGSCRIYIYIYTCI